MVLDVACAVAVQHVEASASRWPTLLFTVWHGGSWWAAACHRNNNAGGVLPCLGLSRPSAQGRGLGVNTALGAIAEDDEEEEEDEEGDDGFGYGGSSNGNKEQGGPEHVPQAFSHFTYSVTEGKKLVCDLQVGDKCDSLLGC